jgi:hypothetical protein
MLGTWSPTPPPEYSLSTAIPHVSETKNLIKNDEQFLIITLFYSGYRGSGKNCIERICQESLLLGWRTCQVHECQWNPPQLRLSCWSTTIFYSGFSFNQFVILYQYVLQTLTEKREARWSWSPHVAGDVDGPENGLGNFFLMIVEIINVF